MSCIRISELKLLRRELKLPHVGVLLGTNEEDEKHFVNIYERKSLSEKLGSLFYYNLNFLVFGI